AIERRKLEAIEQRKRRKILAFALATLLIALGVGATAYYIYSKRTVAALAYDEVKHAKAEEKRAEDGEQVALLQKTNAERDRDNTRNAYVGLVEQKAHDDAGAKKQYDDLITTYNTLQKTAGDQKNENDKLKRDFDKTRAERDSCMGGIEKYDAYLRRAENEIDDLKAEVKRLQGQQKK